MDNPEEVLHILDEFSKLKPKDIPKELEDYLSYVARTGDPVYQWSLVKCLFREKLLRVITDFYESPTLINPPSPAVDNFNYEAMKRVLLERLETFSNAPFTVQRLCELLTAPKKQYNRTDKFMRAIEKNILVVSTREPGSACRQDALSEPLPNGVTDGESLAQAVKNETAHLAESQLNESEDTTVSEESHVDIGSVEAQSSLASVEAQSSLASVEAQSSLASVEAQSSLASVEAQSSLASVEAQSSLAAVAPKDIGVVSVELSNSSEGSSGNKLITESTVNVDDGDCKTPVNSEPPEILQSELIQNSEPSVKSDSALHSAECVGSTEQPAVEDPVQLHGQPVEYDVVVMEPEQIESVKEVDDPNANEVVCESKSDKASADLIKDEESEATGKPLPDESDVSCSSSDTTSLSSTPSEEQDGVSTTDVVSVASSSEVVQGAASCAEAIVDATSSEDLKEVLPEPSETSEVVADNPKETETLKEIGSSSDSLISSDNEAKEENGVGTTDKVVVEVPSVEVSDESQNQSSVTGENLQEVNSELTSGAEEPTVEESGISEVNVVEENIEVPVSSPGPKIKDSTPTDVSSASETCSKNDPKEALPAVSEEAMDVDEVNSCHSTAAGTEAEEMTVTEQIEPMDDSE